MRNSILLCLIFLSLFGCSRTRIQSDWILGKEDLVKQRINTVCADYKKNAKNEEGTCIVEEIDSVEIARDGSAIKIHRGKKIELIQRDPFDWSFHVPIPYLDEGNGTTQISRFTLRPEDF